MTNDLEGRLKRRRQIFAVVIALTLHLVLLLLFSTTFITKKHEETTPVVMTIKLAGENINSNTTATNEAKPKQKSQKKNKTKPKATKKPSKKVIKETTTNKITQPVKEQIPNTTEKTPALPNEDSQPIKQEPNLIEDWKKRERENKKSIEDDFFKEPETSSDIPLVDNLDALIALAETDVASTKDNTSHDEVGNNKTGNIQWKNGGNRALKYSETIELADDIKRAGLKFVVDIHFTVNPQGVITQATVTKSSGNAIWDEHIRRQLLKWVFDSRQGENSFGNISIFIDY